MKQATFFICCGLLILASAAATLTLYPQLPAWVPIHWDLHGHVNGYGPSWMMFVMGPALMAALVILFSILPWLSPKRFEVTPFNESYRFVALVVVAMVGYIQVIAMWAALSGQVDVLRAILVGIAIAIALIGNLMGKIRTNFWMGIRTPWTLANERVWYLTHRLAGKVFVVTSLACLIALFAGAPLIVSGLLLAAGPCIPAVYSYFYYKQLERASDQNAS